MIKILQKALIILMTVHSALVAYFLLFIQYFQQDEWHGFGIILGYGEKYITVGKSAIELILGDRVGARIITFNLFNWFGLNTLPYGLFAASFHFLNTFLVYLLAKKLTKNSTIAFLASFLFLIQEVGNEAYSWFGTMAGSTTSVFFFLLSLVIFLKFIETKKILFAFLSTFLLWVSFLFKEVGAFAFIFYPMLFILYSSKKENIKTALKSNASLIVLGLIMLSYFAKTVIFIPGDRANYINTGGSFLPTIISHTIKYPTEGLIQTILPNEYLFKLSDKLTRIINQNLSKDSLDFLIASQNINAEITIVLLLIFSVFAIFWFIRKIKLSVYHQRTLKISLLITLLSFLPYIVINRSFSYMDSRYYYVASIGVSIFLATIIFNLLTVNKKLLKIVGFSILALYILIHESTLFSDLTLMADRSKERQSFLNQVNNLVPNLKNNTVFFITGNSGGYYGLPELKTPFQSGLGHVLMVKYTTEGKLSPSFFKEDSFVKALDVGFLYDILGQGYREIENQGFGYYYDKSELEKNLEKKLFEKKDIIPLYYDQERMRLSLTEF